MAAHPPGGRPPGGFQRPGEGPAAVARRRRNDPIHSRTPPRNAVSVFAASGCAAVVHAGDTTHGCVDCGCAACVCATRACAAFGNGKLSSTTSNYVSRSCSGSGCVASDLGDAALRDP